MRTRDAVFEAQSLVSATGQLSRPFRPQLAGIESFSGPAFHSAEWRHDYDLTGKRVAVIGTGASAIQFIPAIAPHVEKLTVFQRSAAYVLPKSDKTYPRWQKFLFRRLPGMLLAQPRADLSASRGHGVRVRGLAGGAAGEAKAFRKHLQDGVKDPERQRRLLPHYRIGCKRILLSNDFYPAMDRPNVEVVTESIREVRSDWDRHVDGTEPKPIASSSAPASPPPSFSGRCRITGVGGDLRPGWRDGAQAHLGITVAGFPNFFMLYGPNTNLGAQFDRLHDRVPDPLCRRMPEAARPR